jgi:methyltransferase
MPILWIVLIAVALQRAAELVYARRNTAKLLARGGIELGGAHYPLIVLLHAAWLASIAAFVPPATRPNWALLAVYAALQLVRAWTIASLGPYWTTRVIALPGVPLVRRGPYRFLRHPNYIVVAAEIVVLPLAFGAVTIAVVFTLLDAALIAWRLRVEEPALRQRR